MLTKDDVWFTSIKWDSTCLQCQADNNGVCPNKSCAEYHYDEWGDPIPADLYFMDGNNVQEYLENKRKKMMEE